MFLISKLVLLAIAVVFWIDYGHCAASFSGDVHSSSRFPQDGSSESETNRHFDADTDKSHHNDMDQNSILQEFMDGDGWFLRIGPSTSDSSYLEETSGSLETEEQILKDGPFVRLLTKVCPHEAAIPSDESLAANLYFYRPNEQEGVVIRQARPDTWRQEDLDHLVASGLDANKQTLVYMGGWMQRPTEYWLQSARETFDKMSTENGGEAPFNLLIFDWSEYAPMHYGKAVSFVPYVGEVLGKVLEQLIDRHSFKADLMHLVSLSLSTHIAGQGARFVKEAGRGVIGQITAVDPTGVCFHRNSDNVFDTNYSLRPTDAKLVVARHYNMGQLGSGRLIGGLDILVNGGERQQSMCPLRKDFKELIGYSGYVYGAHLRGCQHEEAPFTMQSDCHEIAYECSDYSKFKMGQCAQCGQENESCFLVNTLGHVMMGRKPGDISFEPGTLMHITTGYGQFCLYHYQVVAQLKPNPTGEVVRAFAKGYFRFNIGPKLVAEPKYRLNEDGIKFTFLMQADRKIEPFPNEIDVSKVGKELLDSLESVSINFMSHIAAEQRAKGSFRYCPDESGRLLVGNCLKTLR